MKIWASFYLGLFNVFSINDVTCKDSFSQALELNELSIPNDYIMASIDVVSRDGTGPHFQDR